MEELIAAAPAKTAQAMPALDLGRLLTQPPGPDDDTVGELRTCDLLIVEDLQHLNPEASDRLARLLDHRESHYRGLVVTSCKGPGELKSLSLRLASRLASGLVAGLEPLNQSSRRRVAETLCREHNLVVSEEVLDWLSKDPTGGVRPILGEIAKLHHLARIYPPPLTVEMISREVDAPGSPVSHLDQIAQKVAGHFGTTLKALRGKNRQRLYLWPRQIAMYLARELTGLSLVEIGRYFGGRDHSTVLHSCKKVQEALEADASLANELRALRAQLA
jgi:chromosomal replication initiator protein